MLVLIIATVVTLGAWTDRTHVEMKKGPTAVPATTTERKKKPPARKTRPMTVFFAHFIALSARSELLPLDMNMSAAPAKQTSEKTPPIT
jgi:hypothetical protein